MSERILFREAHYGKKLYRITTIWGLDEAPMSISKSQKFFTVVRQKDLQQRVFIFDLKNGDLLFMEEIPPAVFGGDMIESIVFEEKKKILVAGNERGQLIFWQ